MKFKKWNIGTPEEQTVALLREAESFACEDGKGVSAWVEGRRVLIGTRELMKSYGVAIPPREYEDQYGQGKQVLYI